MSETRKTVEVKVPKRSGFDKSFHNLLTSSVGTLTPILTDELIPNSTVNLKMAIAGSLPPLATDTFMKCDVKVEAFFVPSRLLYGGYESWFTDTAYNTVTSQQISKSKPQYLPTIHWTISSASTAQVFKAGTLADYLGVRSLVGSGSTSTVDISAMPFLAYHKIYDDWYRASLVQNEVFCRPSNSTNIHNQAYALAAMLPYTSVPQPYIADSYPNNSAIAANNYAALLADGKSIYDLRQRNFGFDYFTNATPSAQLGNPMEVTVSSNKFSISALRAMNSLQQFAENNNLAGTKLVDVVHTRYGANLNDSIAQRAVFLGSGTYPIYSKGVDVTANAANNNNISADTLRGNNPFGNRAGASYGKAYAAGTDFIINGFTANEPGYLMVIASLVPKVTYASGIRRYLTHYTGTGSLTDMANPLLQNTGNQPIQMQELNGIPQTGVFGYTDRYAEFMTYEDELHGLVRSGQTLAAFAAQRNFGPYVTLSSAFLEIPKTYLDDVSASDSNKISNYGMWLDCDFDYKVVMPIAEYSIPSLQNPAYEHGDTVTVHRGGFRF